MIEWDDRDVFEDPTEAKAFIEPEPPTSPVTWTEGSADDFIEMFSPGLLLPKPEPIRECRADTVPLDASDTEEYAFLNHDEIQQATLRLAWKLLQNGPHSFIHLSSYFEGNGVYTLYYHGDETIYEPLKSLGSTCPIYVGKAARQHEMYGLAQRLRDHAQTIQSTNLGIENFTFRFVCLPPNLIEFAECTLISSYRPLWNTCLRGFGKRGGSGQSSDRPEQFISRWDVLHPGRTTMSERPRELGVVEDEVRSAIPGILEAYHAMKERIEVHCA